MTGDEHPAAPPPELPEEFAATYREAFRRALETEAVEPTEDPWWRRPWFLPAAIAASALVLVPAAYGVGKALSDDDSAGPSSARTPAATKGSSPGTGPSRNRSASKASSPQRWRGDVVPVEIDAISADCTAPPSTDAAGERVTYTPENAVDDRPRTAWRCPGTAIGEKLTLRVAADVDVGEVGLIPGYAKTDPETGADRYAENNRVTRVRWTFADGVSLVQRLDPDSRDLQVVRVPRTTTDTVTLEVLAVERGPRNTTAISEIVLRAAEPAD